MAIKRHMVWDNTYSGQRWHWSQSSIHLLSGCVVYVIVYDMHCAGPALCISDFLKYLWVKSTAKCVNAASFHKLAASIFQIHVNLATWWKPWLKVLKLSPYFLTLRGMREARQLAFPRLKNPPSLAKFCQRMWQNPLWFDETIKKPSA